MKQVIRDLLTRRSEVSAGEIADATRLTRQAAHYHLAHMMRSGELTRRGAGRGTRYRLNALFAEAFPLEGLAEDLVWRAVGARLEDLIILRPNVRSILSYAFTEMLNNAIDHSRGSSAIVRVWLPEHKIAFEIEDDGVGVFRTVREKFGLSTNLEAIQELSKGKRSTAPEKHSGQGIFFTSKAVDLFRLRSGGISWTVDNVRHDQGIGDALDARHGTQVRCTIDSDTDRVLKDVFDRFSDPDSLAFSKSAAVVRLFQSEGAFVSRSEAKRLAAGLERFAEVEIDFSGIEEVGQGFVDELFRVWARDHPGTKLVPANMGPAVRAMVHRGLPSM